MSLLPQPRYSIRVTTNSTGGIVPHAPITVKNQTRPLVSSIEDILDVAEIRVVDGSTITYNISTDKYEIKPIEIIGDFGEF